MKEVLSFGSGFSATLKNVRESNLWDMKKISSKLKVPYQTWINWEKGLTVPPIYTQDLILEKIDRMSKGEM